MTNDGTRRGHMPISRMTYKLGPTYIRLVRCLFVNSASPLSGIPSPISPVLQAPQTELHCRARSQRLQLSGGHMGTLFCARSLRSWTSTLLPTQLSLTRHVSACGLTCSDLRVAGICESLSRSTPITAVPPHPLPDLLPSPHHLAVLALRLATFCL